MHSVTLIVSTCHLRRHRHHPGTLDFSRRPDRYRSRNYSPRRSRIALHYSHPDWWGSFFITWWKKRERSVEESLRLKVVVGRVCVTNLGVGWVMYELHNWINNGDLFGGQHSGHVWVIKEIEVLVRSEPLMLRGSGALFAVAKQSSRQKGHYKLLREIILWRLKTFGNALFLAVWAAM